MNITIVGTGYVGLVTGACFSEVGINTTCVDINLEKINRLKRGEIPIYEPGLEEIVQRNSNMKRLSFSTSLANEIKGSQAIFIAVGTPPMEDGSADLNYVLDVAREIGKNITEYVVVVTKSTVPVGTARKVREAIEEELSKRGLEIPFDVASNPEFLKEGDAIRDFLKPDRIVVGVESDRAEKVLRSLYQPFLLNGHPILFMDVPSAEMTKYAANAMLATKISFMNDVANLCERLGADVNLVRKGIGSDPRIGNKFIYPGIGYGGSCFPKDVKALIRTGREQGYDLRVLEAVDRVNEDQKVTMFSKMEQYYGGDLKGKKVAIWGLSFKPKTDDMREAPSLVLIKKLLEAGAQVTAYDPVAMEEAKKYLPKDSIRFSNDPFEALIDADALMLVTEWPEFRYPNFEVVSRLMKGKAIFDGRNIYLEAGLPQMGFDYVCVGVGAQQRSKVLVKR